MGRLPHGPGPVRRQFEHGKRPAQLLLPIGELPRKVVPLQPLPLPAGEIGILNRQFRQRGGSLFAKGLVQRIELADHDAHGPAVGNNVVHVQKKHMLLVPLAEQFPAKQGSPGEIERPPGIFPGQAQDFFFAIRFV
jgi:hypothetical protein